MKAKTKVNKVNKKFKSVFIKGYDVNFKVKRLKVNVGGAYIRPPYQLWINCSTPEEGNEGQF
jgi:hypothetical protein